MGMSASQARLVALTARMSDVEYEGQQINQQRLQLSNKISDIYAQLEAMEVPTPPSPSEYTKIEYFGKEEGAAGEDNFRVDHDENGGLRLSRKIHDGLVVRAGASANVERPTIGADVISDTQSYMVPSGKFEACTRENADFIVVSNVRVADPTKLYVQQGTIEVGANEVGKYNEADVTVTTDEDGFKKYTVPNFVHPTSLSPDASYYTDQYGKDYFGKGAEIVDARNVFECSGSVDKGLTIGNHFSSSSSANATVAYKASEAPEGLNGTPVKDYGKIDESKLEGLYVLDSNNKISKATAEALDSNGRLKDGYRLARRNDSSDTKYIDKDNESHITIGGREIMTITEAEGKYGVADAADEMKSTWSNAINGLKHSYPDNWMEFMVLVSDKGEISFCLKSDIDTDKKDDTVKLYSWGHGDYWEPTDQTISPTFGSAGLESVQLDDGTIVNLRAEKSVDELKKDELMFKYEHEKAVYDAEQEALNNKTSTWQMQDKKLDLKLKRLDTERNALNTEIDAVKKVIQDSTEKGFKTFSG